MQLVPSGINLCKVDEIICHRAHCPSRLVPGSVTLVDVYKVGCIGKGLHGSQQAQAFHLNMMSLNKSLVPCYCQDSSLPRTMVVTLRLKPAPPITLASTFCWTLEEALIFCYLNSSGLNPKPQGISKSQD